MGLFDMFGKGGGTLTFELETTTATCGQTFRGTLVFEGGKRSQKIEGMQVWFVENDGDGESILWAPTKFPLADTINAGETKRYPFELKVPPAAQVKINGTTIKEFGVRGSLDIPKEVDPQAKQKVELNTTMSAEVTVT